MKQEGETIPVYLTIEQIVNLYYKNKHSMDTKICDELYTIIHDFIDSKEIDEIVQKIPLISKIAIVEILMNVATDYHMTEDTDHELIDLILVLKEQIEDTE